MFARDFGGDSAAKRVSIQCVIMCRYDPIAPHLCLNCARFGPHILHTKSQFWVCVCEICFSDFVAAATFSILDLLGRMQHSRRRCRRALSRDTGCITRRWSRQWLAKLLPGNRDTRHLTPGGLAGFVFAAAQAPNKIWPPIRNPFLYRRS